MTKDEKIQKLELELTYYKLKVFCENMTAEELHEIKKQFPRNDIGHYHFIIYLMGLIKGQNQGLEHMVEMANEVITQHDENARLERDIHLKKLIVARLDKKVAKLNKQKDMIIDTLMEV